MNTEKLEAVSNESLNSIGSETKESKKSTLAFINGPFWCNTNIIVVKENVGRYTEDFANIDAFRTAIISSDPSVSDMGLKPQARRHVEELLDRMNIEGYLMSSPIELQKDVKSGALILNSGYHRLAAWTLKLASEKVPAESRTIPSVILTGTPVELLAHSISQNSKGASDPLDTFQMVLVTRRWAEEYPLEQILNRYSTRDRETFLSFKNFTDDILRAAVVNPSDALIGPRMIMTLKHSKKLLPETVAAIKEFQKQTSTAGEDNFSTQDETGFNGLTILQKYIKDFVQCTTAQEVKATFGRVRGPTPTDINVCIDALEDIRMVRSLAKKSGRTIKQLVIDSVRLFGNAYKSSVE